jgi:peptidyl-dipeptidase Dcp
MRVPHNVHAFAGGYAARLYSYLWSDVMAADAAEAFKQAPGGLFDTDVAARWYAQVLSAGATVPAAEAFRAFRGRDPDPAALLRRFGPAASGVR